MALVSGIQYSSEITSRKNFIINGNFDIWQRGTSFSPIADNAYSVDRFQYQKSGAVVQDMVRSTDVPTYNQSGVKSNYSVHLDVTTADASIGSADFCFLTYKIEGHDYAQLAENNATLSFWVKGSKVGTHCVAFRNLDLSKSYVVEYTINVADTWEKKIINVALTGDDGAGSPAGTDWNYTNDVGLEISFVLSAGSGVQTATTDEWIAGNVIATSNQVNETDSTANNFRLAQIQLEKGTVATDFEQRHIEDELALCERYYQKLHLRVLGYTTNEMLSACIFKTMRDVPSVTQGTAINIVNTSATEFNTVVNTPNSMYYWVNATATGRTGLENDVYLDAEL